MLRRFPVHGQSIRAAHALVDAPRKSLYIQSVPVRRIQVGQVWKRNEGGETFLVTKVYEEALATYAVLRKTGAESEPPVRVKIGRNGPAQTLPGFAFTQESDEF